MEKEFLNLENTKMIRSKLRNQIGKTPLKQLISLALLGNRGFRTDKRRSRLAFTVKVAMFCPATGIDVDFDRVIHL